MSDKQKYPRADAIAAAKQLCNCLKPVTERLVVAGSLRRGKAEVGDVEVLYVPKFETVQDGLFDTKDIDATEAPIIDLLRIEALSKRPNINGHFTWGPQNKLAIHHTGIPVDLFATTIENWWVALVIRTGSKETNLKLTTGAQKLGRKLNAYGCGVTEADGTIIRATSEQHVFELCGVPYLEPHQR